MKGGKGKLPYLLLLLFPKPVTSVDMAVCTYTDMINAHIYTAALGASYFISEIEQIFMKEVSCYRVGMYVPMCTMQGRNDSSLIKCMTASSTCMECT